MLKGFVVYLTAYDICYDIHRHLLRSVLGAPLTPFALEPNRRNPASILAEGVWAAHLPSFSMQTPQGLATSTCQLKVFAMGALSLTFRVPFAVNDLRDLVFYHEPKVNQVPIHEHARQVALAAFEDLRPCLVRPMKSLVSDEAYTLFFIESSSLGESDTKVWFDQRKPAIAGLLTQEDDETCLAAEEIEESTSRKISYYKHDLAVVDWDAAIAIDEEKNLEEIIYPLELANLQLAELEAYDRLLEAAVARSYIDVQDRRSSTALRELEDLRIDLARISDMLSNASKLYGDWHLARLNRLAMDRLHLPDWFLALEKKQETLEAIYQAIKGDRNHRVMVVLEVLIVVLFAVDLLLVFFKPH